MRWRVAPLRVAGLLTVLSINVGLLATVAMFTTADDVTAIDKVAWNVNLPETVANGTNRKPFERYAEILAHPLFFKSRAPFVAPPPPPPILAPPPVVVVDPGLGVGGVMVKNGLSKAYLFNKTGAGAGWAGEGEIFQGWTVEAIDQRGAKLEQGGRSIDLQIYPP